MAEATIINGVTPGWNTVNPQYAMQEAMKEMLKGMYISGVLQVEGIIFQSLGRDPDVASKLRQGSGGGTSKRKRSRGNEDCSDSDSSESSQDSRTARRGSRR